MVKNETTARIKKMMKHHFAITAAMPAIKPNPKTPAMIAIIKNTTE